MSFKKYPKIRRIGDDKNAGILSIGQLLVQEKMDGANFRFTWDREEQRLVFGSRNVEYWNEKDIDKNFEHAVEYVRDQVNKEQLHAIEADTLTFFGEAMHPHTLEYNWDEIPSFLGFGIYDHAAEEWLGWELCQDIFDQIGLPTTEVYYFGPATDLPEEIFDGEELSVPKSEWRDGKAEGIVIKNEETGQKAKFRTQEFKEKHKGSSPTNPDDYQPSDSEKLARTYTTEARVLKMIHKYDDRGREISMEIMEDLWRDIFDDIIEEEYDEIFLGNHVIDTKSFRSEVASITAEVLQNYLQRPDGSVLNEADA